MKWKLSHRLCSPFCQRKLTSQNEVQKGTYSKEFTTTKLRKAFLPDGPGETVAEEAGIFLQALYYWLRKLRGEVEMRMGSADPKNRSMLEKQERLRMLVQTGLHPGLFVAARNSV